METEQYTVEQWVIAEIKKIFLVLWGKGEEESICTTVHVQQSKGNVLVTVLSFYHADLWDQT